MKRWNTPKTGSTPGKSLVRGTKRPGAGGSDGDAATFLFERCRGRAPHEGDLDPERTGRAELRRALVVGREVEGAPGRRPRAVARPLGDAPAGGRVRDEADATVLGEGVAARARAVDADGAARDLPFPLTTMISARSIGVLEPAAETETAATARAATSASANPLARHLAQRVARICTSLIRRKSPSGSPRAAAAARASRSRAGRCGRHGGRSPRPRGRPTRARPTGRPSTNPAGTLATGTPASAHGELNGISESRYGIRSPCTSTSSSPIGGATIGISGAASRSNRSNSTRTSSQNQRRARRPVTCAVDGQQQAGEQSSP